MEKRILVIGATGLLGEPVAIHLKQCGFIVWLMVRDIERAKEQFGDDFEIVKVDILDEESLEKALDSCFGVHINLSGETEKLGVENVSSMAAKLKLQRITYISGTSVAEENTWVPLIKRKFLAAFEKIGEKGDPAEANNILGAPKIKLEDWLQQKKIIE